MLSHSKVRRPVEDCGPVRHAAIDEGTKDMGPNWAMHLYSWTSRTLGNLISVSGFDVVNGCIVPDFQGGRLGAIFPEASYWRRVFSAGKALRTGRFHT